MSTSYNGASQTAAWDSEIYVDAQRWRVVAATYLRPTAATGGRCPAAGLVGLTNDPPYWPADGTGFPSATVNNVNGGGYNLGRGCFVGRHNGVCNVSFCDGHVKAMTVAQLAEVKSITDVVGRRSDYVYKYLQAYPAPH